MTFQLDASELERQIATLGAIGVTPEDGLFRPVYSAGWSAARDQLEVWMREAGLETRFDAVGNLIGRLPGRDTTAPVILTGSHFDTVRNAGMFDGALGVLVGIAALKAIGQGQQPPEHTIEVVAFCEEEGSRFPLSMLGSRSMFGMLNRDELLALRDDEDESLLDVWERFGISIDAVLSDARTDVGMFVELHVEQGGTLEARNEPVGIVSSIVGQITSALTIRGEQNHAGTTPMALRKDALAAAAEMMLEIERIAAADPLAVATVGTIECTGSGNVVPGETRLTLDVRHPETAALRALWDRLTSVLPGIADRRGVELAVEDTFIDDATVMDSDVVSLIRSQADRLGLEPWTLHSGAGHDSQISALRVPTGMIFTPSRGGISHSPEEWTDMEDIVPGATLLTSVLWAAANPGH